MQAIIEKIQINIPFTMLYESYLATFMEYGLNPEIGLDAAALDRFSAHCSPPSDCRRENRA